MAPCTFLHAPAASYLHVDLTRPLRSEPLIGVGHSPAVPVMRLDRVQVGTNVVTGLEASIFDLRPAGVPCSRRAARSRLSPSLSRHFRVRHPHARPAPATATTPHALSRAGGPALRRVRLPSL